MFKINSIQKRILKDKIEPYIYLFPFMFFLLIFTIYPVINVFLLSFKENYSFLRGTYDGISFENYKEVLLDDKFRQSLINTFLYVLFVVPLSTAIAVFVAYLLNQKIKGIAFFQTAFFMPMVTSITAQTCFSPSPSHSPRCYPLLCHVARRGELLRPRPPMLWA